MKKTFYLTIHEFNENVRNNKKTRKNQGGVLTQLLISQLLRVIENRTLFKINAKI